MGAGLGKDLLGGVMHSLGEVTHVGGGDSGDGDSPVLGEVDAVFPCAGGHLLRGHSGEGEHSNLVSDVLPVTT